jgi:putative phosphoesterase
MRGARLNEADMEAKSSFMVSLLAFGIRTTIGGAANRDKRGLVSLYLGEPVVAARNSRHGAHRFSPFWLTSSTDGSLLHFSRWEMLQNNAWKEIAVLGDFVKTWRAFALANLLIRVTVRIAVLNDIHGNLPALEAVLAELDADLVVVGGDVVAGPMAAEVLDALNALSVPVRWVMGNADREVLSPPIEKSAAAVVARFAATRLTASHRALVASFETTVVENGILFCHGTPRSDTEIVTIFTPDEIIEEIVFGIAEPVIVGGHVHHQFDRQVGSHRWLNAGSVGLPYESRPGAFWLLLDASVPTFRCTEYDIDAAVERIRATGIPDPDGLLRASLIEPTARDEIATLFEALASRG